jgi:integrase
MRETLRKTRTALAQCLDHHGVDPNPARDDRVKLPKERKAHIPPPLAEHVERVVNAVAREYVLPLLVIDECGPRVSELETCEIGDLDEHRRAIRVRWTFEKNDRYRHLELPDDLFEALVATLPPREDRDLKAPLFPGLTDARLRMAITRACRATGTPHFSPHGLRRRRGSLHYKRTGSLAEVAELLGDSKRVAADHYVYALTDYREVERSGVLAAARP